MAQKLLKMAQNYGESAQNLPKKAQIHLGMAQKLIIPKNST